MCKLHFCSIYSEFTGKVPIVSRVIQAIFLRLLSRSTKTYVIPKHLSLHTNETENHTSTTGSLKLHLSYTPKIDISFPHHPGFQILRL